MLGQPDFNHSGCNGDGNFQTYPLRAPASAATLCSMPVDQISPLEGGSFANMAVDVVTGDLYVPDFDNHRVLLFRSPFTTDTIADDVWGQADFAGNECNRGRGVGAPDAQSLCFRSPFNEGFVAGVALDADGNLWVADNQNNRVLRFPRDVATGLPGHVADLVLGQPDFSSWTPGVALDRMWAPAAVRVDANGAVYVADSLNGRILVFERPLSSGVSATRTLGSGFRLPTGLEFDPGTGGIWVSDRINNQLLLFMDGQVTKVLFKDVEDDRGTCGGSYLGDGPNFFSPGDNAFVASYNVWDSAGSIGIDADGNVLVAGSSFVQDVWRFRAPFPDPQRGRAHSADARLFPPYQFTTPNEIGLGGIYSARGVAVARPIATLAPPIPVLGGGWLSWDDSLVIGGIAPNRDGTAVWLADPRRHRVFRILNPLTLPIVDVVLGQTDLAGTACNQGRGLDSPSRDSLCQPGAVVLDRRGNVWVSDHARGHLRRPRQPLRRGLEPRPRSHLPAAVRALSPLRPRSLTHTGAAGSFGTAPRSSPVQVRLALSEEGPLVSGPTGARTPAVWFKVCPLEMAACIALIVIRSTL